MKKVISNIIGSSHLAVLLLSMAILSFPLITKAQNLLNEPQKLVVDAANNRYLVSNYGDGNVVQIQSDGSQSTFLAGEHFIDGMTIFGDYLYGACGPIVKKVSLEEGNVVSQITIPGVQHLSSVEADTDGNLYLSDRFGTKIIKVSPDLASWEVFAEGQGIQNPNGIYFDGPNNRLVICLDKSNSLILAINMTDRSVTTLKTTTMSDLDGILKGTDGNFYITGYYLQGIYKFDSRFINAPELVYTGTGIVYPTLDVANETILFTRYNNNSIGSMSLVTGVDDPVGSLNNFQLFQNYPNPFNPSTTLKFDLAETTNTKLEVFNITGTKVKTLLNEVKGPGSYSVQWNGKDESGNCASSGIYFFRLTGNGIAQTCKATLLK